MSHTARDYQEQPPHGVKKFSGPEEALQEVGPCAAQGNRST
jgi:hypothetical protein